MNDSFENACSLAQSSASLHPLLHALSLASRALALLVLLAYVPVLVAAGLLIVLTSSGPAFVKKAYRRDNGSDSVVYLYELRTECWRTWQPTRLGQWLLLLDLPRLPRLVNVLQGEIRAGERVQRIV